MSRSCERRLRVDGVEGEAELEVGGWTSEESGFDLLFQQAEGMSGINIIALFKLGMLGLAAACMDPWPSPEQFKLLQPSYVSTVPYSIAHL